MLKNRDEADIKLLRVELSKLELTFKKYRDLGCLDYISETNMIQLPERFINYKIASISNNEEGMQEKVENLVSTQCLLDDINFVKN